MLSFFGVSKSFTWESPSYTISLAFLIVSAALAASIGAFVPHPNKTHGVLLLALFVGIALVQYAINSAVPDAIPLEVPEA